MEARSQVRTSKQHKKRRIEIFMLNKCLAAVLQYCKVPFLGCPTLRPYFSYAAKLDSRFA